MLDRRQMLLGGTGLVALSAGAWFFLSDDAGSTTYFAQDGVALRGADPVAYFTQGEAVIGSADLAHDWAGVTWHFASAAHREAFRADPEAYAPQYGGYCAWAVSQGYTAKGDAKHWRIVDGKLYLNYNADVKDRWEGDIPGFIASADKQWPTIIKK